MEKLILKPLEQIKKENKWKDSKGESGLLIYYNGDMFKHLFISKEMFHLFGKEILVSQDEKHLKEFGDEGFHYVSIEGWCFNENWFIQPDFIEEGEFNV